MTPIWDAEKAAAAAKANRENMVGHVMSRCLGLKFWWVFVCGQQYGFIGNVVLVLGILWEGIFLGVDCILKHRISHPLLCRSTWRTRLEPRFPPTSKVLFMQICSL